MNELPKGWAWTTLGHILPLKYGKGLTKSHRAHGSVPVYGSSGVVGFHAAPLTRGPTLVIGRKGSVGAVHLSSEPCWPIDTVYYAEQQATINLKFFGYLMEHLDLARLDRSTAVPGLTLTDYEKIQIALPPLPEQGRIVAEIEKQFTRLDEIEQLLTSLHGKAQRYSSALIRNVFEKSFPMTPLRELASIQGGLTMHKDRSDIHKCAPVPYLRVANVQRGFLDLSIVKDIMATPEEVNELALQPGDVLLTEGGDRDKLGRGWVWQGEISRCIHQNHVFRARLSGPVLPKWVSYYANEIGQHYFHREGKQTTNLASINITKLGSLPIPTPSLAVQEQLLNRIETQTSASRHLADELSRARSHATRLRQSILAKAFSGQLVPQDSNDEPASVLLERISAERGAYRPNAPRRRRASAQVEFTAS